MDARLMIIGGLIVAALVADWLANWIPARRRERRQQAKLRLFVLMVRPGTNRRRTTMPGTPFSYN